jgi:hypothetical protein
MTIARPSFSEYHLALASMSATDNAKNVPPAAVKGGSGIGRVGWLCENNAIAIHGSKTYICSRLL